MARPEKVTDDVKRRISQIHDQHPKWVPSEIRGELKAFLQKKHGPDYSEEKHLPGESSIRKTLNTIEDNKSDLDDPWSVGRLASVDISPQALPTVLKFSVAFEQHEGRRMTIREAKWAARFSHIYELTKSDKYTLRRLLGIVADFAWEERTNELEGFAGGSSPYLDAELYTACFDMNMGEPVFDEQDREKESEAKTHIREGLEETRIKPRAADSEVSASLTVIDSGTPIPEALLDLANELGVKVFTRPAETEAKEGQGK